MRTRKKLLWALAFIGGVGVLPFVASGAMVSGSSEAVATPCEASVLEDGGTCCFEIGSNCYPGDCSEKSCSEPSRYWRTDGKSCAAT